MMRTSCFQFHFLLFSCKANNDDDDHHHHHQTTIPSSILYYFLAGLVPRPTLVARPSWWHELAFFRLIDICTRGKKPDGVGWPKAKYFTELYFFFNSHQLKPKWFRQTLIMFFCLVMLSADSISFERLCHFLYSIFFILPNK